MRLIASILGLLLVLALAAFVLLHRAGDGAFGELVEAGQPTPQALPADFVAARDAAQESVATRLDLHAPKQILFGDLHVHSSFSVDAFQLTLPSRGGSGVHPVADACDFARFCANLDFWSINDHAASLTPRRWQETIDTIRGCEAISGDTEDPDLVSFLGWEWTQMGSTPENHYGHKNVVLRDLDDERIPARPIFAEPPDGVPSPFDLGETPQVLLGLAAFTPDLGHDTVAQMQELARADVCPEGVPVRELPADCMEGAQTPGELFAKLDEWGLAATVIPHGTVWGMYTPPGSSWAKQLQPSQHDPGRQRLIEVYSGHGNAEEYRPWKAVEVDAAGVRRCPPPGDGYTPACWQAGELIRARCLAEGTSADECETRAADARRYFVEADRNGGPWVVPGATAADWSDAGQCRDCFQPALNYRPQSSVQSILALGRPDAEDGFRDFRFGFIASSDNHTGRPGTGYKELERREFTDARMSLVAYSDLVQSRVREPKASADPFPTDGSIPNVAFFEAERGGSFFYTGGLAAVHATSRDRGEIFDALERRETYGTSGPRILLWFDLLDPNAPGGRQPMGSEANISGTPTFRARAAGSFEQKPGCPEATEAMLGPDRLASLCLNECYHPSETRRPITRLEVVRIRNQQQAGDDLAPLIEDPWKTIECPALGEGCEAVFSDPDFSSDGRATAYYVRAIEAPSPTVSGDPLGCDGQEGDLCEAVAPCFERPDDDDCLAPSAHRAWSSPIFLSPSAPSPLFGAASAAQD